MVGRGVGILLTDLSIQLLHHPLLARNYISHNPLPLWLWSQLAFLPIGDTPVRIESLKRGGHNSQDTVRNTRRWEVVKNYLDWSRLRQMAGAFQRFLKLTL